MLGSIYQKAVAGRRFTVVHVTVMFSSAVQMKFH